MNRTGLNFYYNYLLSEQPKDFTYYPQWLERPQVRKAIHVGNLTYDDVSMKVHQYLNDDMLKSIRPWLEALLEADYKVLNNYFDCCNQIKEKYTTWLLFKGKIIFSLSSIVKALQCWKLCKALLLLLLSLWVLWVQKQIPLGMYFTTCSETENSQVFTTSGRSSF